MNRILLVDDEPHVLSLLKRKIPWGKYGFELAAYASNGQEALEWLRTPGNFAQVVLTDLNMPVMDGFELIRSVGQMKLGCALVVLSIYNDYESIREAFRLGAQDYILKHEIEEDGVIKVLRGALNSRRFVAQRDLIQAQFAGALHGVGESAALGEKYEGTHMLVCVCAPRDEGAPALTVARASCEAALADYPDYLLSESGGAVAVLLRLNPAMAMQAQWLNVVHAVARKANAALSGAGGSLLLGVSDPISGPKDIESAYTLAKARLEDRFFYPDALVFPGRNGVGIAQNVPDPAQDAGAMLKMALDEEHEQGARLLAGRLEDFRYSLGLSRAQALAYCAELVQGIWRALKSGEETLDELEPREVLDALRRADTMDAAHALLSGWYIAVCSSCAHGALKRNERLIHDAVQYIKAHYADALTLKQVGAQAGLSANYFSSLFATTMGKSFSAYLVEVRIEAAKKMLTAQPGAKIYQVSQACGFPSVEHFSRTFKGEAGMSPNRYIRGRGHAK